MRSGLRTLRRKVLKEQMLGEKLLKILSSNRVTLPKEFCEKFNLKRGDFVKALWNEEEGLRLVPGKLIFKITIKPEEKK